MHDCECFPCDTVRVAGHQAGFDHHFIGRGASILWLIKSDCYLGRLIIIIITFVPMWTLARLIDR